MFSHEIRRDALGLGIASATAYLLTATRFVMGGDTGEFATLFAEPGVGHPPGYPVYLALQRAFFWMPGTTVAQSAARVAGLCAAGAVVGLYCATRAWGASRLAGLFAAIALATSGLFWDLATRAEVFTLHCLTSVWILWACAPDGPVRGVRRAVALGALVGLALGNHLTVVLLAPLLAFGLFRAVREDGRAVRTTLAGAASALPGLLSYGLLAVWGRTDDGRWLWGDTRTLAGIVHHMIRADYGVGRLAAHGGAPSPRAQLAFLATSLPELLHLAPVALALVAFVQMARNPSSLRSARGVLLLTLGVCGPLFVSRFNIEPTGIGRAIVARFHLLPALLVCLFAAFGWDHLAPRVPPRILVLSLVGFTLAATAHSLPAALLRDDPRLEGWAVDALRTAPQNSALFVSGDHRGFALLYAQRVLRVRRDVQVIAPHLLLLAPYRARAERRLGHALPAPVHESLSTVEVARTILASGRPLFMTDLLNTAIVRSLPTWPEGVLVHVAAEGAVPPQPGALDATAQRFYVGYHLPRTPAPDPWLALVHEDYARVWQSLAEIATRYGATDLAARMRLRAATFTDLGSI